MSPPLVLDIDGTLTRPAGRGLDPRVFDPLREWDAPVVLATGKAVPYPVALCHFIGIPERVIAENGGVTVTEEHLVVAGDRAGAEAVAQEYDDAGYGLGWEGFDTINRWRETELAVAPDQPLGPLATIAAEYDLTVVDTGYAYHVTDTERSKGRALESLAPELGIDLDACVAVGDSENDVATFGCVGRSYAVANADDAAKAAADEVLDGAHADGTLAVLSRIS